MGHPLISSDGKFLSEFGIHLRGSFHDNVFHEMYHGNL